MQEFECIVAGCSAVGGILSRDLAASGVQVAVFEEHAKPGKFHKCSGIMSKEGIESLGVDLKGVVLNQVRGARIFCGNAETKIESRATKALVIDRQAFDEKCAEQAKSAGAKLFFNSRVAAVSFRNGFVETSCGGKPFKSQVVAGCDGASSTVALAAGFPAISPKDFVLAWEGEFSSASLPEKDLVHIFLDCKLFSGFFGWVIPVNEQRVRVGFATRDFNSAPACKKKFLETRALEQVLRQGKSCCEREFFYVIPLRARAKTQIGNVLLCGDSAGMTKATTGGGVVFAQVAAQEISRHVMQGAPLDFENAWRAKYGKTLAAHRLIRDAFNSLGNSALKTGVFLSNFGPSALLSARGDMDFFFK